MNVQTDIIRDFDVLHPEAREDFQQLANELSEAYAAGSTRTYFKPFETWRHPYRQAYLITKGVTKAGAWRSAHQYGLAVDFVPHDQKGFNWAADNDWEFLRTKAKLYGLTVPISWDLCHVEHPLWNEIKVALFEHELRKDMG